jgi:hypothetical protein
LAVVHGCNYIKDLVKRNNSEILIYEAV